MTNNRKNPVKISIGFDFEQSADSDRYYVYSIRNKQLNKFYIGISGHPNERLKNHLRTKNLVKEDFANAVLHDARTSPQEHIFEFGIGNPNGYPGAFLGCIAEVSYMLHLEKNGVEIYNQNKFGGHPALSDEGKWDAFRAIVKILDHTSNSTPSNAEMHALEQAIPEIQEHVTQTENRDIINSEVMDKIEQAWLSHNATKKAVLFSTNPQISDLPTSSFLPNYERVIPKYKLTSIDGSNDNSELLSNDQQTFEFEFLSCDK